MADATLIKFYKSSDTGSLGNDISGTQIISRTTNNLFPALSRAQQVSGLDDYLCIYIKNTADTEVKDMAFWLTQDMPGSHSTMKWGFEANPRDYKYQPNEDFNGSSDFIDVADAPGLDLSAFTIFCWFKTSADYSGSEGALVNKGGFGSDTGGQNMNYGIWVHTSNELRGGFETGGGTDNFVTFTGAGSYVVNDGTWHSGAVTYNGTSNLRLYVDSDRVASLGTGSTPETNAHPLTIGKNSRASDRFFNGKIDEVRVWNKELTWDDIIGLHNDGKMIESDDNVYSNKFGGNNNSRIAQSIASTTTPPSDIEWKSIGSQPDEPNIGRLGPDGYRPIWLWRHVEPDAPDVTNERAIFNFRFQITTAGTGTGGSGGSGGGTGGNPPSGGVVDDYKIAVVGDWGEENETDDVIEYIDDNDYNLIIGTGDYSYTSSDSEWFDLIDPIDDIFKVMANGNHDNGGALESHLGVSNTHYSFDFQNVHILVLDTEKDMDDGSSQHTFAQNDLEKQVGRGNIDWIFVVFHRPMLGPESDHEINEEQQIENYMDMFEEHGVHLVLQGHNHHWFRSYPVRHTSGSSVTKVINSTGPYTAGDPDNWLIAVTSGTGGHDDPSHLYDLDSTPSYSAYQNNSNNGIFSIESSNNGQTLTCRFINTAGSVKHTFVMNKT